VLTQDPSQSFEELKTKLLSQIEKSFPIEDRHGAFEVRVHSLSVNDDLGVDDIKGQLAARVEGKSWAAPVYGTVQVVDKLTGKVLLEKPGTQLAKIPKLTRHYSYIVSGQEKFITNQWRLRPGPYVRETERGGEFKAQFQLAKGKSFNMLMDPASGYLSMDIGGRKVPVYSVLSSQGVTDDEMKASWGPEVFAASKAKAKPEKDVRSFYAGWKGTELDEKSNAQMAVKDLLAGTRMDPLVAKANLGRETDTVDHDVLLRAAGKLVDVSAGRRTADPIDSLRYKELWTAADQFAERIEKSSRDITGRVRSALGNKKTQDRLRAGDTSVLRDVVAPDLIQRPLFYTFSTSLAANGKQTNPLSMLADKSMTTIMGPGGIQNQHAISNSNTAIDPSHLGYLDPVFTPESNPGVNTHLTAGVKIKDKKPFIRLYNIQTGKMEDVDAAQASTSHVVLPDQVKWNNGKPTPLGGTVRVADADGDIRDDIAFGKAHYVMPSSAQVFALETNLVPFMQNDSAGRTTMSARHMAQSISIVGREAPAVQVEAGGGETFERIVGSNFLAHKSPIDGVIKAVGADNIVVQGADGKRHDIHIYDHYPLNDKKAQLHSTANVKVGDTVKKGQGVADNNYTKDGDLALGTNLRTAYIANGLNHEDGIVISESAAAKMGSEHLYKPSMLVQESTIIGKKEFLLQKPTSYGKAAIENIGDDGVIRIGATVRPGDPLVLALGSSDKASSIGEDTLRRLSSKVKSKFSNSAMVWDADYEGEVVRVSRKGKGLVVHVKTKEPMQVGSKISTRHSAKGIVAAILPDSDMPHDGDGRPVQMLINPLGVPGRMNAGQILETVAGKIAEKTGKPYVVKNFQGGKDYLADVKAELKKHGISETETLYDPKTGRKLGEVTVGPHCDLAELAPGLRPEDRAQARRGHSGAPLRLPARAPGRQEDALPQWWARPQDHWRPAAPLRQRDALPQGRWASRRAEPRLTRHLRSPRRGTQRQPSRDADAEGRQGAGRGGLGRPEQRQDAAGPEDPVRLQEVRASAPGHGPQRREERQLGAPHPAHRRRDSRDESWRNQGAAQDPAGQG